ncbi:hypothetical protein ACHAXA_000317 [Cyclostephanos tholiformis]|uniref:50S ribosomal protein L9, chloroplastic n=1 Tax=Cyclostephanos tholiformis TaxID=382380 RepID=A0ABD3R907_9STRA
MTPPPSRPPSALHPLSLLMMTASIAAAFVLPPTVVPPSLLVPPLSAASTKKAGGGKIQVQLLETIPSIGQCGDITFVSSAVFQNQLKKGNKARLITDEEVRRMEEERAEQDRQMADMASRTKAALEMSMIENLRDDGRCGIETDVCGVALEMRRRAGPEGNLFGGVTPRMILDGLKERYPDGSWDGRMVKVTDVRDADGNEVKAKDIKKVGDYTVTVALWRGIDVTFVLSISAE